MFLLGGPGIQAGMAGGAPNGIVSVSYISSIFSLSSSGDWTTADLGPLPPAGFQRLIVLGAANRAASGRDLSSVVINGVSATVTTRSTDRSISAQLAYAEVNAGTTGITIDPTWSGTASATGWIVWQVIYKGTINLEPLTTFSGGFSGSLAVQANTVMIGNAVSDGSSSSARFSWSGIIEDVEGDINSDDYHSGASGFFAAAGSQSIAASVGGSTDVGVIARFYAT